jgi:hypothetical protein
MPISGYWWLLMSIPLMAIGVIDVYSINGYWGYYIDDYYINDYWWLFY